MLRRWKAERWLFITHMTVENFLRSKQNMEPEETTYGRQELIDLAQAFVLKDSPQFAQESEWIAEMMATFVEQLYGRLI